MNFSLNYVWIQAVKLPQPEKGERVSNPIPQPLMANVQDIATKNYETPINIWTDIYGIGNHPDNIFRDLNFDLGASNIRFRALDSIEKYKDNPLFEIKHTTFEEANAPIWKQVDLARLYVLEHCLENEENEYAIYADMDLTIGLDALSVLEQHGVVVSMLRTTMIENQFLGLRTKHKDFLVNEIIPTTEDHMNRYNTNGWLPLAHAFKNGEYLIQNNIHWQDTGAYMRPMKTAEQTKRSYQGIDKTPT